jgi:hypothetical protein
MKASARAVWRRALSIGVMLLALAPARTAGAWTAAELDAIR